MTPIYGGHRARIDSYGQRSNPSTNFHSLKIHASYAGERRSCRQLKQMKPGRYIRIGSLWLPITDEHAHVECYKVGHAARAARKLLCRNHGYKRMSKFGRVWAALTRPDK